MPRPVPILAFALTLCATPALTCTIPSNDPDCALTIEISAPAGDVGETSARLAPPALDPGDRLPDGAMAVINTEYFGLPPARDGWWYFEVGDQIYRADPDNRVVLERVTHLANATF